MSALSKLDGYKLFYEQVPTPKHKVAATAKRKPSRKSATPQLPRNVLDNL